MLPADRALRLFMGFSAALYGVAGLFFLLAGGFMLAQLDAAAGALGLARLDAQESRFWFTLAIAMMGTVTTCCLLVWREPVRWRAAALPVVVSKATSTLLAVGWFVAVSPALAYLSIVVADGPLCVATAVLLWRAHRHGASA